MIQAITSFLTTIFEWIVNLLDSMISNQNISVGLAIIVFSIFFKICLFPLNIKQIKSSFKMREIQPEVAKLQAKYKGDPQKLNQATMQLYKESGASPFSGCLPLLLQWPVLMAMYFVFKDATIIQGHSFLWLNDLSVKDPTYILPILTAITTYISTTYSTKQTQTAENAKNMSTMTIVTTGMMLFMSATLNSAVVIYYVIGNIFQFAQTYLIQKFVYKGSNEKVA